MFHALFPSDPGSCLKQAKKKSDKFATEYTQDKQKAVQLVNIYTQECKAYKDSNKKPIYYTLNKNLRSENPEEIWKEMSTLLSKGLVLLGRQEIKNLYRGCRCPVVKIGTPFTFKQFASTSSDPAVAVQFLKSPPGSSPGKAFIHIKKAEGTGIQPYSSYPQEKEFLLGPDIYLNVVEVEENKIRAREKIMKLVAAKKEDLQSVVKFVVLVGSKKAKKTKGGFRSTCLCG